jgi:putative autoinducer-2 (AI-2) aldolase
MDWGMKNRLSQLIQPDGHCFFLPIDHGYFQGPTHCLEKPAETIKPILAYCDALFVTRGVLRSCVNPVNSKPIILRVSGATSMAGKDLANESLTTSIQEIIRLNVAAVGISVFVGSDYEHKTLLNLAELVNKCEDYGIPVMAVTAVGKEMEKREARYWCEKDFDKVVNGCPVPVVMAGGPKCKSELEVLEFVYDGMQKGAIGINLGRNVWQSPHPIGMARALRAVVHENATVKQAHKLFNDLKNNR